MEKPIAIKKLERFLQENGSGITLELGTALINHMGGADEFIKTYKDFDETVMKGGRGDDEYDLNNVMFMRDNKAELLSLMREMADCGGFDSVILMIHTGIKEGLLEDENLDNIGRVYFDLDYNTSDSSILVIIDWIIWAAMQQLCLAFDADYASIVV